MLNFYLSSITTPNFSYEPNEKTNKYIWEYLSAANLLKVEDLENKEKIKNLEIAANNDTLINQKYLKYIKKFNLI